MELFEALRGRRTVQRFAPGREVPDEVLHAALEAATWAPNHKLTWPWRFTLPGSASRELLFRIGLRLKGGLSPAPEIERAVRCKMLDPSRLVVVSQALCGDDYREREDYAACCCAIQNLMLALHDQGFASKWGTGRPTRAPETYDVLGIEPTKEQIVGFVWVGLPMRLPEAPSRRPWTELTRTLP